MGPNAIGIIAVFIPIVVVVVTGLVIVTWVYFNAREKQMLIEKGMSAAEMKMYFKKKQESYLLLQLGIILIFLGVGIGFGLYLQDLTGRDYFPALTIISLTGVGMVAAYYYTEKVKKNKKEQRSQSLDNPEE